MSVINNQLMQAVTVIFTSMVIVSCVTKTVESPSMKFNETAVISVGDPNASIVAGSTFSWLPEAVRFYEDERLSNAPIKSLIETEVVGNLKKQGMVFVDSINGAKYEIAYTAALESSLDDAAIIRRFGLLPGMAQVPKDDTNVEKGSLIIYVFEKKSGEIIWRVAAQVGVKFNMPAEQRKERVIRVVGEMFKTFPTQLRAQRRAAEKTTEAPLEKAGTSK